MKSFDVKYLENISLTNELIRIIRKLGEYKGKQELYQKQSPEVLENLKLVAFAQSTESSNRLEQITAPPKRLKELLADKTKPKNRSESEIAGYRDVLSTIHHSAMDIPLTVNVIKQLHRDLMRYTDQPGGKWKSVENTIIERYGDGTTRVRFKPVEPFLIEDYMMKLVSRYNEEIDKGDIEPLILMPLFIFDFTCIHPFKDGNGRSSRLLTTILLYHQGYDVVRYISLEKIIELSKESYYETLETSSQGWHKGKHDIIPFLTYYLSIMLAAYDEFEKRADIVNKPRGTKTDMIKNAIDGFKGNFTISDIEQACPLVSRDMIRNVMNNLKAEGIIANISKGRYAKWRKI
ncbi:MAG: Fic family protein [Candidatus Stygibacter australis]|nr:Fic family protein [Candidatus Stygibacter australis]